MRDVLVNYCSFPEHLFAPHAIDVEGNDPQIDILLGLLVYAFYPNVCYTGYVQFGFSFKFIPFLEEKNAVYSH